MLDVVQSSFEEKVSKKTMISEFINSAFGSALQVLYESHEITEEGLEDALDHLPDYLQDVYRKRIATARKVYENEIGEGAELSAERVTLKISPLEAQMKKTAIVPISRLFLTPSQEQIDSKTASHAY